MRKISRVLRLAIASIVLTLCASCGSNREDSAAGDPASQSYDLVISGGRVMDPETGFDGIRNLGVRDGRIIAITSEALSGERSIDASGQVVAPGFIDTHFHGQDVFATRLALRDGVTTALDLEAGGINIDDWYAAREGSSQLNYGVAVSHMLVRMTVHDPEVKLLEPVDFTNAPTYINAAAADGVAGWSLARSNTAQMNAVSRRIDEELRQGALGVGAPLAYMARGVNSYEMFEVQRAAARYGRVTGVHTRYHIDSRTPTEAPIAFDEVFANAVLLKAPLLMCHNTDYGWEEIEEKLQLARQQSLNMWSEHYPYDAGSTIVSADFLRPELWEQSYGFVYADTIYDPQADRFLDKAAYLQLVASDPAHVIFVYMPGRNEAIPYWLTMPHMTVASDGVAGIGDDGELLPWDADPSDYAGHPRTAGTHARSLRLGREYGVPLMQSLSQLSYWSAKHLGDTGLLAMQERGRLQAGAIADITIFDPLTVTDHATYKAGEQGLLSTGINWVIVNGKVIVAESLVQRDSYPGQAIRYPVEPTGRFETLNSELWIKQHTGFTGTPETQPVLSHLH